MKLAVLGTGMVGETIASKLVTLGHEVCMGSRSATNEKALAWARSASGSAAVGTFEDAARFAELVFNCTQGATALASLQAAGATNLAGKILIDVTNPLDFSKGMPPFLSVSNTDSLGEQIQREFPQTRVVKTLNTVNCKLMVDAQRVANAEHDVFLSGNDADAKHTVTEILTTWFGWKHVVDLGDITTARATESYLHLWLRVWGALKTGDFNIKIVR